MSQSSSLASRHGSIVIKARSLARSAVAKNILLLKQLWVWPIVAAILLATVGWQLRGQIERSIRQEVDSELKMLLATDVKALQMWLQTQEANATATASDHQVAELVAVLVDAASQPGIEQLDLLRRPELVALRDELRPTLEAQKYGGFIVVNAAGMVVASGRSDAIGQPAVFGKSDAALRKALAGQATVVPPVRSRIVLPDRKGEPRAGLPTMFALAPVFSKERQVMAVLGLRIDPWLEFVPILEVARSGRSGETYALDDAGVLISQSRFDPELKAIGLLTEDADSIINLSIRDPGVSLIAGERPVLPRSEQPLTRMAAAVVSGDSGSDVVGYRGYRGVPVIGAWKWFSDYEFGVATEIEVDEAFQTLYILRNVFFYMLGLLSIAAVAIFVFSVRVAKLRRDAQLARLEARQLGQYTLEEKLGAGGMGVVYRARHALLHRPTAVKFLDVDKLTDQSLARFEREVQMTSRLNHPNTIAVYDYGRTVEGVFYYAMEYLDGLNLEELVRRHGPQPDGRVVSILTQVCGSLHEAHSLGLVHRDIKPANIVLNFRGGVYDVVKVLDFGLVKALEARSQALQTMAGGLAGTPQYLSPEAIESPDAVDARSDLYAVGAVGYFLLTGTPVFEADGLLELLQQHRQSTPQPPSQRCGRPISPDVEKLILGCLAKEPAARPKSAKDLASAWIKCSVTQSWTDEDAQRWWNLTRPPVQADAVPATGDGRFDATLAGP